MDDKEMAMVSEEEERVCMQVRNRMPYIKDMPIRAEDHKWYVDVIDHRENAASNAVEIQRMGRTFHWDTASASSNSFVYVFGGYNRRLQMRTLYELEDPNLTDFWYTDTYIGDDGNINASGWLKGSSMQQHRSGARSVVVDEKIYVFGGGLLLPDSWAEVYDIKSNRWSMLAPPTSPSPTDIVSSLYVFKCAALDFDYPVNFVDIGHNNNDEETKKMTTQKLVLVYFLGPLYSYDVILGTWELFDANFGKIDGDFVVVSCGTTPVLLTIKQDERKLYGYHLGQRKWFNGPVSIVSEEGNVNALPGPDFLPYIRTFFLVPLGRNNEKLCVLWSYYPSDHKLCALWVHCTKLSVSLDGQSSLAAKVESTNLFKLHNGDELICCVPLVTRRTRKRAGASVYMEEEEKKKNRHELL